MTKSEKAAALFQEGWNCAQATMLPFAEDFGLPADFVKKAAAGFGGGMGGCRMTCGAVSAMVFYAGLTLGNYAPDNIAAKTHLYRRVQTLVQEFRNRFGSTECMQLLRNAGITPQSDPSPRTAEYYAARPCAAFIAQAAGWIQEKLLSEDILTEDPEIPSMHE